MDESLVRKMTGDFDRWSEPLTVAADAFLINTRSRQVMFMAQCAHESGGFKRLVENLNYSTQGLLATWPRRFTAVDALAMAHRPEAIAERVYGGRFGNGPEGSGDGWRYRGRGLIQVTFLDNYRMAGEALSQDYVGHPELLEQPDDAALVAAWFWSVHGCNELADAGDFIAVTRRVNGGTNGLDGPDGRLAWLKKAEAV